MDHSFFNLYHHGFIRVAVGVPDVRVADPQFNTNETIQLMKQAVEHHAVLIVFPELGLTAYSCEDLFQQQALINSGVEALQTLLDQSKHINIIAVVGLPIQINQLLFNCAVVIYGGRILGVVPKTYLPNYREFYELRQFVSATVATVDMISLCHQTNIPFGERLVFSANNQPAFSFFIEICEDLWVPIPPSSYAALAGATVLLNLSASNITIGKESYRKSLVANQSARCLAAYLYATAGVGESSTDMAWDGQALAYENGVCLAESDRFQQGSQFILADIDLDHLKQERMRQTSFSQNVQYFKESVRQFRQIQFDILFPSAERLLCQRNYSRYPFVPSDAHQRDQHCQEAFNIQVQSLIKRLKHSGLQRIVVGVSGGLDSTHALIIACQVMDALHYPRHHVLAYSMPGYATSDQTKANALALMKNLGCAVNEIDIRPSCEQMLKDIDHPFSRGESVYDTTFENVQAGERTNHLFRLANFHKALVLGTGDLSELALGWCTYGVGDHMSHYAINASIPKTLIQFMIRWVADSQRFNAETNELLNAILATEFSPELIPGNATDNQPYQKTESVIGPYELQDFHLYYTLRFGYLPTKIAFLAYCSWRDRSLGNWPGIPADRPGIPPDKQNQYTIGEIKHWLKVFLYRFFQTSQFKRTCIPNAPKVGSGGSLSPRGDYRAPSDSEATIWLNNAEQIPDIAPPDILKK